MFVPLGGGLGPEVIAAPPQAPSSQALLQVTPPVSKARSESSEVSSEQRQRSGETTPLDLSKSPDHPANHSRDFSDTEDSAASLDTGVTHQRLTTLPPLQRRASKENHDSLKSRELEAQLHFFKAKQLEFLKDQHQKQAAALAAAQAAAVAAQQKSRCEECNINFSKHQNYIAHKKYYCSAANSQANSASNQATGRNGSSPGHPAKPSALPLLTSDNEEDKSSDDGKSQRKLSPPMTSPAALMMAAGLTSPSAGASGLKDLKEGKESHSNNPVDPVKAQISPNSSLALGLGVATPPPPVLPHFVCEGCGIRFKSVSNLQAHQARYCAGLRKASEDAFEAMMLKQKQQQQAAAAAVLAQTQQQKTPSIPMLEMMSLLNNAKSNNLLSDDKLSSLMMSSMAAAMQAAAVNNNNSQHQANGNTSPGQASEDYYCFLCGYKEESVERLKDHINLHFIGKVKRKISSCSQETGSSQEKLASGEEIVKKIKLESSHNPEGDPLPVAAAEIKSAPASPKTSSTSNEDLNSSGQLKCTSCDIGFSHLSNFVAHKKYYCRGLQMSSTKATSANSTPTEDVKVHGTNGKESPK